MGHRGTPPEVPTKGPSATLPPSDLPEATRARLGLGLAFSLRPFPCGVCGERRGAGSSFLIEFSKRSVLTSLTSA